MHAFSPSPRVALLIDADNASSQTLPAILSIAHEYGDPIIKRAYGNWDGPELTQWKPLLPQHGIQAVHQYDYVKGKNATDMCMTIDAMDILHSSPVDIFVMASSDSDFTPLAFRLRAAGKRVIGLGKTEASIAFRQACSCFHELKNPSLFDAVEPLLPVKQPIDMSERRAPDPSLVKMLRQLIAKLSDTHGNTELGALGKALRGCGHTPQDFGHSSLLKVLTSLEGFTLYNNGSQYQVSLH